ncbi:MAG: divalent-cation tolerance protein CutA [Waddliaceae bacterium]
MTEYIEVHWTCGSLDEGRRVCRYLVQERYVACAQIIPWIESVYQWNNQLETTQESKVVLKTVIEKWDDIKQIITENSQYDVPEITYFRIEGGDEDYLKWMKENTATSQNKS